LKARGIPDAEWVDAIASDPAIVQAADVLDVPDPRDGGRPRDFHPYAYVLLNTIARRVYGGRLRRAVTELGYPANWQRLRETVQRAHPDRPDVWLRQEPMREHQFKYFKPLYLSTREADEQVNAVLIQTGAQLATSLGLLTGTTGSLTNPTRQEAVEADGKVVPSITRYGPSDTRPGRNPGEFVHRRFDPDVKQYETGDKRWVTGNKYVSISTRGDGWHERVMLGRAQPPDGSELAAVLALLEVLDDYVDITALLYDGALRGNHINEIVRRFGIVCVAAVIAERVDPNDPTKRTERRVPLGRVPVTYDNCRRAEVELWAVAGAPCEAHHKENGDQIFEPLELQQLQRRGSAPAFRL
jgi:hypothetical protein